MTDNSDDFVQDMQDIQDMIQRRDTEGLMGHIAVSLARIANAQEAMVTLANLDVEHTIQEAVEQKAEERAQELDAEKTKRTFIGKR